MLKLKNIEMSDNQEAAVVLIGQLSAAVTGFVAAIPIPIEWKAPIVSLTGGVTAAILIFWKTKINTQKEM